MEWIKVEDRLPNHLEVCVVWCENSYYTSVLNRAGGLNEWCSAVGFFKSENVTHWMPLPEPPKQ